MSRALAAETLGTAFLLAIVVGSGIMGESLAGGNVAIALLANSLATGGGLMALILIFGPISGAHFNPVVSFAMAYFGEMTWGHACQYLVAQIFGAIAGVMAAHVMFDAPVLMLSHKIRAGFPLMFSEVVATFGLLAVILGCRKERASAIPFAVGGYIMAAYWFTASTCFANPAVTIARSLTDTFAGIRPADAPGFIVAQMVGTVLAIAGFRWFAIEHSNEPLERKRDSSRRIATTRS